MHDAGREDLSFRAEDDGRVWVWDATHDQIVFRADMNRGDRLLVSPEEDFITLDIAGRHGARATYDLSPKHEYEVYFRRR
jgi:hypothetical protein